MSVTIDTLHGADVIHFGKDMLEKVTLEGVEKTQDGRSTAGRLWVRFADGAALEVVADWNGDLELTLLEPPREGD